MRRLLIRLNKCSSRLAAALVYLPFYLTFFLEKWIKNGKLAHRTVNYFSSQKKPNPLITLEKLALPRGLTMVREAGLEPARPEWTLEPESSESANSTTRAWRTFCRMPSYNSISCAQCQAFSHATREFCRGCHEARHGTKRPAARSCWSGKT